MKNFRIVLFLALLSFSSALSAQALEVVEGREDTWFNKAGTKLGRGGANLFLGWLEIPYNVALDWEQIDPLSGTFTGGAKGFLWTGTRMVYGAFEIITFPFPLPGVEYDPMLQPGYVARANWGEDIPGITDPGSNDPHYRKSAPIYPESFRY